MTVVYVLYVYAIFIFVSFIVLINLKVTILGSLVISLIAGQIILNIMKPPQDITGDESKMNSSLMFYMVIQFGTPIFAMIYAIIHAFHRCKETCDTPLE